MSLLASVARALFAAVTSELTLQAEANRASTNAAGAAVERILSMWGFLYGSAPREIAQGELAGAMLAPLSELLFDRVHDPQEGLELGRVRRRRRQRRNGPDHNRRGRGQVRDFL